MQNANYLGIQARLAYQRFQPAIAQDAIDRVTSSATHRILNRDASRIYTAPPSTPGAARRPKPIAGRMLARQDGRHTNVSASTTGISSKPSNGATGNPQRANPPQRLYAQALRIISSAPVRTPVPGTTPVGPWPPGSVFEYGSPANRQLSRRIESRLVAAVDWLREQIYRNEKDPVRTEPLDLPEKLAQEEAKSGSGRATMEGRITDPKYIDTHDKMELIHKHGDGTKSEIHCWKDRQTGEGTGHKFKDPPANPESRSTRIK